LPNI